MEDITIERIARLTNGNERLHLVNDKLYEALILKDREIEKLKQEKDKMFYHLNYLEQFYISLQR